MFFNIINLDADDWKLFRDIRLEALQEDPVVFGNSYQEEVVKTEDFWRKHINNMWFVVMNNQVVGMIGLLQDSGLKKNHRAQLISLWVKPAFRSQGIGKALVQHALMSAQKQEIRKLYLYVTSTQQEVIKLYEALGFYTIGLLKEHTRVNDLYFDSYMMER